MFASDFFLPCVVNFLDNLNCTLLDLIQLLVDLVQFTPNHTLYSIYFPHFLIGYFDGGILLFLFQNISIITSKAYNGFISVYRKKFPYVHSHYSVIFWVSCSRLIPIMVY